MNTSFNILPKVAEELKSPQIQKSAVNLQQCSYLLAAKKATKVDLKGSSLASNHPSHFPLLSQETKENMVEGVVESLEESKGENSLEIETIVDPSPVVPAATQEMTKILENMQVRAPKEKKLNQPLAQPTATIKVPQGGFTLNPLEESQSRDRIRLIDHTKLAEDFRFSSCKRGEMAGRHMWKRLNFFLVTCRYIADKASYLERYDFPSPGKNKLKQLFQAKATAAPSSFKRRTAVDSQFARAHVSILNKMVVMKDNDSYSMYGELAVTAQKIKTNLHLFLNICDIAPLTINSIDWYAEYYLRLFAYELLDAVKKGEMNYEEAAHTMARSYGLRLIELQDKIRDKQMKADNNCFCWKEYEETMAKMMADKEKVLEYIDGMLEAINHFRLQFPNLRKEFGVVTKPGYSLYEKIS